MSRRDSIRSGTLAVLATGAAGVVGGLVWLWVAPRVKIRIEADGASYVDPSLRQYIDADVWYTGICLLIAVVAGLAVWRWLRQIPTAAVVSLAVGGLLASTLVWQVGQQLGQLDEAGVRAAKSGDVVSDSLDLGARGLLGLLPVVAVATWLLIDLVVEWRRRRREPTPWLGTEEAPSLGTDPAQSSLT